MSDVCGAIDIDRPARGWEGAYEQRVREREIVKYTQTCHKRKFLLEKTDLCDYDVTRKSLLRQKTSIPRRLSLVWVSVLDLSSSGWPTNICENVGATAPLSKDSDRKDTKQKPNVNPEKRPIITRIHKSVHGIQYP
jgi:hypothetical protein